MAQMKDELSGIAKNLNFETPATAPDEKYQEILRIVPFNANAKRAFSEIAEMKQKGQLLRHHAQFICITGEDAMQLEIPSFVPEVPDSLESTGPAQLPSDLAITTGYWQLDFGCTSIKTMKWTFGRGEDPDVDRGIDMLLCTPTSKSKGFQTTHVLLAPHSTSAAWLIASMEQKPKSSDVQEIRAELGDRRLSSRRLVPLDRSETRLKIRDLEFRIIFSIKTSDQQKRYLRQRDALYDSLARPLPLTKSCMIPLPGDTVIPGTLIGRGIGSGAFGCVYEGFCRATGDPQAIKEIKMKERGAELIIWNEIKAMKELEGPGLIRFYDWCNEYGEKSFESDSWPMNIYIVQELGLPLIDEPAWDFPWNQKRKILYELLQGISKIHGRGWMHRDINPPNMIFIPNDNDPKVILCDYGKLLRGSKSSDLNIAGTYWWPPEILSSRSDVNGTLPYDQSLDVWMLAAALVWRFFPTIISPGGKWPNQVGCYEPTRAFLRNEKESGMGSVLCAMLHRDPKTRISAEVALEQFDLGKTTKASEGEPSSKRQRG